MSIQRRSMLLKHNHSRRLPTSWRKKLLFLLRTYQNRGDSQTHSVSRHDLCPADGLCVQSLVLCERFKWEINIKRPFMAPSNKQLDSFFCFASLLRFASTGSTVSSSGSSGDFWLDSTCKLVKLFSFMRIVPHLC